MKKPRKTRNLFKKILFVTSGALIKIIMGLIFISVGIFLIYLALPVPSWETVKIILMLAFKALLFLMGIYSIYVPFKGDLYKKDTEVWRNMYKAKLKSAK